MKRYIVNIIVISALIFIIGKHIHINNRYYFWNIGYPVDKNVKAELSVRENRYILEIYGNGAIKSLIDTANRRQYAWLADCVDMNAGWKIPLEEVIIQYGILNLPDNAFVGCNSLETVHISSSVSVLGKYSFAYCNNLSDIIFGGTSREWEEIEKNSPEWNLQSSIKKIICANGTIEI